jgi:hypothetical protein
LSQYERGVEEFGQHVVSARQLGDELGMTAHGVRRLAKVFEVGTVVDGTLLFTPRAADAIRNRTDRRSREYRNQVQP